MERMMWDYDSLFGKAEIYFARAREHPRSDDDVFAMWLLLGLEFLLRAPLALENQTLLAEPNGDSIMHAAGFPGKPGGAEPKSILTHTVISRLGRVIDTFTTVRQDEASALTGLRNRELHTGVAALAIDTSLWLPRFMRVVDSICGHLDVNPTDLLGSEVVDQARALVDAEDKKLAHDVQVRIAACSAFFKQLQPAETALRAAKFVLPRHAHEVAACPSCGLPVVLNLDPVRTTTERLVDGEIQRDVIYVAKGLDCLVCGLALSTTAEIKAAGLQQQYNKWEVESFEQRFMDTFEPDYGND
jgi:hypothetical protein